jgi:hypothetical protein
MAPAALPAAIPTAISSTIDPNANASRLSLWKMVSTFPDHAQERDEIGFASGFDGRGEGKPATDSIKARNAL